MRYFRQKSLGFTLVEILIVIVVIGTLAALSINYYAGSREKAYLTRGQSDMETIANAAKLYANKHDTYPADASRDVPTQLKEFIADSAVEEALPNAPWPGSVFDYEAWNIEDDPDDFAETIQISIRFCPSGGPLNACKFPKQPWVTGFGVNSAFYYCIKGYCRSHQSESVNYPGYCVNCPDHTAVKKPGES